MYHIWMQPNFGSWMFSFAGFISEVVIHVWSEHPSCLHQEIGQILMRQCGARHQEPGQYGIMPPYNLLHGFTIWLQDYTVLTAQHSLGWNSCWISVAAAPWARASRSRAGMSRPGQLIEPSRAVGSGALSRAEPSRSARSGWAACKPQFTGLYLRLFICGAMLA